MKIAFVVVMLLAANALWFTMMAELRRRGYTVSYINFLSDLKNYHLLIVGTRAHHERHKFTLSLIVLYLMIAVTILGLIIL